MDLNSRLRRELEGNIEENEKRNISITLPMTKLQELDQIVSAFTYINKEKTFSRQALVEIAIDNLIEESKKILKDHGIEDINELPVSENVQEKNFDTVIFPAQLDGFEEVFLEENRWYYVRLGKDKIDSIKFVACYVGAPVSAITHYAEVKKIEMVTIEGKQKYIIYFKGEAKKLDRPIPIGRASSMSVRANRYVTLEQLKLARSYEDLL